MIENKIQILGWAKEFKSKLKKNFFWKNSFVWFCGLKFRIIPIKINNI